MCCVGRRKGSMYLVNERLVVRNLKCCKDLANTKLDLRNAANSLQIEGKGGWHLGTQPIGGGGRGGWRDGGRDHICILHTVNITPL